MSSQIDLAIGVVGAETGFISLANSNDPAEQLVGISQIVAGLYALSSHST